MRSLLIKSTMSCGDGYTLLSGCIAEVRKSTRFAVHKLLPVLRRHLSKTQWRNESDSDTTSNRRRHIARYKRNFPNTVVLSSRSRT
jgi:hypothetical protein